MTEVIDRPDLPILFNLNIGHAMPRCIMPFGIEANVDADQQVIRFKKNPCMGVIAMNHSLLKKVITDEFCPVVKHWLFYYFSTAVGGRDLQRFASFCRDLLAMKMPYGQNEQNNERRRALRTRHYAAEGGFI